jgi:hypothetical protein
MKNIFTEIGLVISAALVALMLVFMAIKFLEKTQDQIGVEFRAACSQANGKTVWNGRHWECLK